MSNAIEEKNTRAKGIWSLTFIGLLAAYFLVNLSLNMANNLSTPFAKSMGATPVLIGMVATGFTYGSIVFKLFSGPAIDSFNRKGLLLGAFIVIGIAFLGDAFAPSVPVLMCFRILQGVGQAFTATTFIAIAADSLPRERMSSGMGVFALGTAGSTLFGALVGLKLQEATSFRFAYLTSFVILALGFLVVSLLKVRHSDKTRKFRISLSGFVAKEAIPPALMQFLFMMAWSCVFGFLVVYGQEQGLGSNVGLFNTAYGLAVFVAAPLGGRLIDRFGYYMMIPMLVLMSASLWLISFSSNLGMLLFAAVVGAFGYGAAGPVVRSMAMSVVPEDRRGAASSTLFVASDLGQLAGPVVGGLLVSSFGYAVMFRIAPVWVLLAVILLVFTNKYVKDKAAALKDDVE
ncbi:MFS transporter [Bifidobacterium miconisargentati]|uniref:MFS transporter n=1 Tax=Bifidobacterium miconisargentati TaxID=2834437 RepID=UPI001BDCB968|nr:MFS transporter [Bifidobacterium miconisargentati]MBW3090023.1 MFS transporter [Bifidobacterium miconisargentati]